MLHNLKVNGKPLAASVDEDSEFTPEGYESKAVMARFMLRTPLGESHGVVSFAAMRSKLDWFGVYVDGECIYGDIDGKPLASEMLGG